MGTYSAIKNTSFDVIRPPDYDNKATRSSGEERRTERERERERVCVCASPPVQ